MEEAVNLQVYKVLRTGAGEGRNDTVWERSRVWVWVWVWVRAGLGGYGNGSLYVILGPRNTGDKNCVSFQDRRTERSEVVADNLMSMNNGGANNTDLRRKVKRALEGRKWRGNGWGVSGRIGGSKVGVEWMTGKPGWTKKGKTVTYADRCIHAENCDYYW